MKELKPRKIYEKDPGDVNSFPQSTPASAARDNISGRMNNMSAQEVICNGSW